MLSNSTTANRGHRFEGEPVKSAVMERRSNRAGGIPAKCQYVEYQVEMGTSAANSHHGQQYPQHKQPECKAANPSSLHDAKNLLSPGGPCRHFGWPPGIFGDEISLDSRVLSGNMDSTRSRTRPSVGPKKNNTRSRLSIKNYQTQAKRLNADTQMPHHSMRCGADKVRKLSIIGPFQPTALNISHQTGAIQKSRHLSSYYYCSSERRKNPPFLCRSTNAPSCPLVKVDQEM